MPDLDEEIWREEESAEAQGPGLGTLFKQLADDGRILVRQEIGLATLEVRTGALRVAKESAIITAGALLIGLGLVVLFVFLILLLGRLLGDRYWLSTLIVGSVLVAGGLAVLLIGRRGLRNNSLKPRRAVESIHETRQWAASTADQIRRDLSQ